MENWSINTSYPITGLIENISITRLNHYIIDATHANSVRHLIAVHILQLSACTQFQLESWDRQSSGNWVRRFGTVGIYDILYYIHQNLYFDVAVPNSVPCISGVATINTIMAVLGAEMRVGNLGQYRYPFQWVRRHHHHHYYHDYTVLSDFIMELYT